ncbi:MAG: integrase core domain-containing protein [Janthinobacterium lividum]
MLTDDGSCFRPKFAKAYADLGADYRHTQPYTPQTNGMVERFNGRIESEVLGVTIYSHRDLEQLLRGFNAAYNTRRRRVLSVRTPSDVVTERLAARRTRVQCQASQSYGHRPAQIIVESAKNVSQPES